MKIRIFAFLAVSSVMGFSSVQAEDAPVTYKCTHYANGLVSGKAEDEKKDYCSSFSTSAGQVKDLRECAKKAIAYYNKHKPGRCWGRSPGTGDVNEVVYVIAELHNGYAGGLVWNSKATMEWEDVKDLEIED